MAKLGVGVNTAVRVSPVPLMAPKVPPETLRSPAVPFQAKLVLGSSENVNERFAVSPAFNALVLEVIVTEGVRVSRLMLGVMPAEPLLPAASW